MHCGLRTIANSSRRGNQSWDSLATQSSINFSAFLSMHFCKNKGQKSLKSFSFKRKCRTDNEEWEKSSPILFWQKIWYPPARTCMHNKIQTHMDFIFPSTDGLICKNFCKWYCEPFTEEPLASFTANVQACTNKLLWNLGFERLHITYDLWHNDTLPMLLVQPGTGTGARHGPVRVMHLFSAVI